MESNQLSDVKQRLHDLRTEKGTIRSRKDSLTQKFMKPPEVNSKTAWDRACEGDGIESTFEIDAKSSIREELEELEGRERFIDEAIKGGMSVEDRLLSQESLKACAAQRVALVAAAKQQLLGLREVEKANRKFRQIRDGVESDGFRTGSMPVVIYDLGGRWNDRYGGRLVSHCKEIAQNYPEVAKLAMSDLDCD